MANIFEGLELKEKRNIFEGLELTEEDIQEENQGLNIPQLSLPKYQPPTYTGLLGGNIPRNRELIDQNRVGKLKTTLGGNTSPVEELPLSDYMTNTKSYQGILGGNTPPVNPQKQPQSNYASNLGNSVVSGLQNTSAGLYNAPELIASSLYNAAAAPQNLIAKTLNIPGLERNYSDMADSNVNPIKYTSQAGEYMSQKASEKSSMGKFDKGIWENITSGNLMQAGEQLSYAMAENIPQYLLIGASAFTGNPQAGLALLGASSAGNQYGDLKDGNLDENTRNLNAVINGAAEIAFESVSTLPRFQKIFANKSTQGVSSAASDVYKRQLLILKNNRKAIM